MRLRAWSRDRETSLEGPTVLIVADGGPEVGGGHVMRSLTLARALGDRGARPVFLAPPFVAGVLDRYGPDFARAVEAAAAGFDAVVFDHFGLGAEDHRRIAAGRPAMAIDDLADRPLAVGLVLDPGPARRPEDYAGLVPAGARLLLGPAWALVRPEFAAVRGEREHPPEPRRVLVSLGLTDVGGITARVVQRLLPRLGGAQVDVVVGQAAPSLPALARLSEREPRLRLHVDAADMAGLCAGADMAVGAGGSSLWERCVTGLPGVLLVLADNQAPAARAVAEAGAAELVDVRGSDFDARFDRAFTGLMRSPDRRARMGRAAAALCDGAGAQRAAEAFLELAARKPPRST